MLSLSRDQHVTFLWIPSHCGITGNERADSLAKEGAKLPTVVPEPLAVGDVLHLSKIRFTAYLQDKWEHNHAKHLYTMKPKLQLWDTCNQHDRIREVTLSLQRSKANIIKKKKQTIGSFYSIFYVLNME